MITALCLCAVESVGGALEAEKSERMKSDNVDRVDRYTIHVYNMITLFTTPQSTCQEPRTRVCSHD